MEFLGKNLDDNSLVMGEIYKIECLITNKCYVGQTLTHRLNRKKYRPFGSQGRFKDHVSEAINNSKKNQCVYLNNAIRKYGPDNFTWSMILRCNVSELDKHEIRYIKLFDTKFPNGYNLTEGGRTTESIKVKNNKIKTELDLKAWRERKPETREKISKSLKEIFSTKECSKKRSNDARIQHDNAKLENFKDFTIPRDIDVESRYLRIIRDPNGKIKNYRITLNGKRVAFHIGKTSQEEAYKRAMSFLKQLQR